MDDRKLNLSPLKIKYLREFMDKFQSVRQSGDEEQAIIFLVECAFIAMQQYCPSIKTVEELEDLVDIHSIYTILEIGADIKMTEESEKEIQEQAEESSSSWETFDIAKLESELFLLGIWKDYEELETSLSMPELVATLEAKRDLEYQEKKFAAAIQGVDLDEQTGNYEEDPWEAMKARVFSGGQAENSGDILAFQGINAQKAGFGIGMGLSYEKV